MYYGISMPLNEDQSTYGKGGEHNKNDIYIMGGSKHKVVIEVNECLHE